MKVSGNVSFFFALKRTGKAFIMFRFKHETVYSSALQNRTQAYSHKHNQCVQCCLAEGRDVKHEALGVASRLVFGLKEKTVKLAVKYLLK